MRGWAAAAWTYDLRGRVASESQAITGSGTFLTQWGYNSAGIITSMIYPGGNSGQAGEQVNFSYHPQGALNSVIGSTTYLKSASYDAAGRVELLHLGQNGSNPRVIRDYVYNPWTSQGGRLEQIKSGVVGSLTSLQDITYTYDTVGNIQTIQDARNSSQKQCFQYDALDRLTKATTSTDSNQGCAAQLGSGNYDESYSYADNGNLLSKTGIGTYTYSSGAHVHAVTGTSNGWSFGYDANGNMTSRNIGTSYTLSYDTENHLTGVSGGATASFVYDGDGKRVKGTAGGATTVYIGNYFEWNVSTATMQRTYYAGGERIAVRTGSADPQWLLGDHLGSTSSTANYDGSSSALLLYKPWGEVRYTSGTTPTTRRYTGQQQDSLGGADGLYFYQARWYDPALSRWAQPDSIIPDAGNPSDFDRYSYARNNPVRYKDSNGHCIDGLSTLACVLLIGGLIVKAVDYAWTTYDIYQSSQILSDPNASRIDKIFARLNIGMGIIFEAAEPDDILPVGLPLDDVGRKAVMKGARQAFEEGGEEGLQIFIRQAFGDKADDVLRKMGIGHNIDPGKIHLPTSKVNQVTKRGWSMSDIQDIVRNPALTRSNPSIVNKANGNPVTYFYKADGHYVVIDNITGQVVQISDLSNPNWIDEMTNQVIQSIK